MLRLAELTQFNCSSFDMMNFWCGHQQFLLRTFYLSSKSDFSPNLFPIKGLEKADEHIVFHASWG